MTTVKVWTISKAEPNSYIMGVYLDEELALKSLGSTQILEEWEPMLTEAAIDTFAQIIEEI